MKSFFKRIIPWISHSSQFPLSAWVLTAVLSVLGLTACSSDPESATTDNDMEEMAIGISLTRGAAPVLGERTYRITLFDSRKLYRDGTYRDPGTTQLTSVLLPCNVTNEGIAGAYDVLKGLYAKPGTFQMVINTPGIPITTIDATNNLYGYSVSRKPLATEADKGLYISHPMNVTISGRGVDSAGVHTEILHVDNMDDSILREYRSKLQFAFKCGEELDKLTITKVWITNIIGRAYYNPFSDDYHVTDATDPLCVPSETITLFDGSQELLPNGTDKLTIPVASSTNDDTNGEGCVYILSENYAKVDETQASVYPIAELHVAFDNGCELLHPIKLTYDYKPHYSYRYLFTVNHFYLNVSLTVSPWNVASDVSGGTVADDYSNTSNWKLNIAGWNVNPDNNTTITNSTTNP
jgi:hypothetical protein